MSLSQTRSATQNFLNVLFEAALKQTKPAWLPGNSCTHPDIPPAISLLSSSNNSHKFKGSCLHSSRDAIEIVFTNCDAYVCAHVLA